MRQPARIYFAAVAACCFTACLSAVPVPQFGMHEVALKAVGKGTNPYVQITAEARITLPDSSSRHIPLFWDGGATWKFRLAPDQVGSWKWAVQSSDAGLNGQQGTMDVVAAQRKGSLQPLRGFPHHFQRQNGERFWFMGDTAWALFTDSEKEKHDRSAAMDYLNTRAAQGFNVVHSMLLSEAGWGNAGGPPFHRLSGEQINPDYWREVDQRLAYANSKGIICGLAIAWGDKRKKEPYAWRRFPSLEARQRYARYIAARYSAYDVFFIVSGEWHGEVHTRPGTEAALKQEFIEIGRTMQAADPHGRMMAIHPMTDHGSVREFNVASWMSFGDYQQNYYDLHARILASRDFNKPVVNSEYGYFLRDQSGDGVPDKENSTSLDVMRHATWDIAMGGAYVVTGFGTTYFGGNRDPGPFDINAPQNKPWEQQIGYLKRLFTALEWWKLQPQDDLLKCATPRSSDRKELGVVAPPQMAYWCLAEPGKQYLIYLRGLQQLIELTFAADSRGLENRLFNPRTGEFKELTATKPMANFTFRPPDEQDWVVVIR